MIVKHDRQARRTVVGINLRLAVSVLLVIGLGWDARPSYAFDPLYKEVRINLPGGVALDQALLRWGAAAGVQVMMSADDVRGIRVEAINKKAGAGEALRQLLHGSGLVYTVDGNT